MTFDINHNIYAATLRRGGFGVFYSSKNLAYLNGETQNEIEKKSNYTAPNSFRDEDIENYPVNFASYFVDDNGKQKSALLRSKYTGATNHTPDRAGNFLAHTIIFENALDDICLPLLLKSVPFLDHLTLEDESNFIPPAETFEYTQPSLQSYLSNILKYLCEDRRRLTTLLRIIDEILDGWLLKRGNNITVYTASGKESADLIFALYSIIPSYLINHFSFATYTYNPNRVNYKICGVVPGCITEDFPEYIKVFELEKQSDDYLPKYFFSKMILNWIDNKDVDRIIGLEKLLKEYDVKDFDKQVEIPFKIEQFKKDLQSKNISDLYNVLSLFSPSQSELKSDLIELIRTQKPQLYFEYMKQEMSKETMRQNTLTAYISTFEDFLRKINGVADKKQVFDFYNTFEENARRRSFNIEIIISNLLTTSYDDIKQICLSNDSLKAHLFKKIEDGWENVVNKDEFVRQHENYLLEGSFPNISMWMNKKKIENDLKEGLFFVNIKANEDPLKKLEFSERRDLFIKAIIQENNKGKMDNPTLSSITSWISDYFNSSSQFWEVLFRNHDVNNDSKEFTYSDIWPISLIKRNVILLETQKGRLSNYQSIVENLNEYEIQWLADAMIMLHLNTDYHTFIKMLSASHAKQKSQSKKSIWERIIHRLQN